MPKSFRGYATKDEYWETTQRVKKLRKDEIAWYGLEEWERSCADKWKFVPGKGKEPDGPGIVYVFLSVTGWLKCGRGAPDRLKDYSGPSKPKRVYFQRPTKRMRYAEYVLKKFLAGQGHDPVKHSNGEWFLPIKEQKVVVRCPRSDPPPPRCPRGWTLVPEAARCVASGLL